MEKKLFQAGAAKGDITPARELLPMPLLSVLRFTEIADPVYVRALALSDGVRQSLFIMLDMTLVPNAEETLDFLAKQTGIPRENIFLAATHTHGVTPISLVQYKSTAAKRKCQTWYGQIKKTMLSTVRQAQANMVPARFGYGTGSSYINVNRDAVFGEKSRLGINLDRPSDKTLRMVRFEDMQGKAIALIVNYACHAVVLNGCLSGLGTCITGDLPGRICAKLEERMQDTVVLWCSGAAGDQNPRLMTQQYVGKDKKGKAIKKNLGAAGHAVLDYLSDEHARDILRANQGICCGETEGKLFGAERMSMVDAREEKGNKIPYILRLWMIGDIVFEGISAEIVTSVGKAVREVSPYEKTILVSHTCGYQGYVADDWEYEHGAFEAGNARIVKGAAQRAFVQGFQELFGTL